MKIAGLQKTSLIDYPNKVCAVFFTSGCNFRCPFCYNPELVLDRAKAIDEKRIDKFLEERKKYLDAILLSGGEPTMQKDIIDFVKKIKKHSYLVGIETNGSKPEVLKKLLDNRLVDFIAMDIKSDLERYDKASGVKVDIKKIKQTVELIKNSNIDYEFRTTVVPGLFDDEAAVRVGELLKGAKKYVLQQFRNDKELVDKRYEGKRPYAKEELNEFKKLLEPYIDNVKTTGI